MDLLKELSFFYRQFNSRESVAEFQNAIKFYIALKKNDEKILIKYKDNTSLDENVLLLLKNIHESSLPRGFGSLTGLTNLNLMYCNLENVNGLSKCIKLETLNLLGSQSLLNVDGLKNCVNLEKLNLSECSSLKNVDGLENCSKITNLNLSRCRDLENLEGLKGLINLTCITIKDSTKLKSLKGLENAKYLEEIEVLDCKVLNDLSAINDLHYIKAIYLRGNKANKNKLSPALRPLVVTKSIDTWKSINNSKLGR